MGGCASKPKESDIVETSAVTDNAVVESKQVEPEAPTQEKKADEAVAEKTEESAGDGVETQKEAEPAKPAEAAEPAKPVEETEPVKPVEEAEAAKPVKKAEPAAEAAVKNVEEKASGETEPPKKEEAVATNDTKTNDEPLVTL